MRGKMRIGVKITLILLVCLVVAVIVAAGVCASIAHRVNDHTTPAAALSYWQFYIKDDALLSRVATPGSHDAGTAGMPWYSETQDRDIGNQLECGTRYFDLRIKEKKGELRIYHGPAYSLYLKDVLEDVRDFITANPSEAIILDVHKFGNAEAKTGTVAMLDEYLAGRFISNDSGKSDLEYISNLTLGEARGKCLLIWGDDDEYVSGDSRYFLRNDDGGQIENGCLQSFYTAKWNRYYSSEKYIQKAVPAYIDMYKNSVGGIFVLQSQLTDGCLVCGPRYREGQHEKNMNDCVAAFAHSENLQYINVVMRDYVSPRKNAVTLALNVSKGLVKEECASEYSVMIALPTAA